MKEIGYHFCVILTFMGIQSNEIFASKPNVSVESDKERKSQNNLATVC